MPDFESENHGQIGVEEVFLDIKKRKSRFFKVLNISKATVTVFTTIWISLGNFYELYFVQAADTYSPGLQVPSHGRGDKSSRME